MKKIQLILIIFLVSLLQACSLEKEEFNKITPDNFYNSEQDAKLAIAALYNNSITKVGTWSPGLFVQNINSVQLVTDISAGDMMMCSYGDNPWEYLRQHEWAENNGFGTNNFFHYYNHISNARIVANQIGEMTTVSEDKKSELMAEAFAVGGWKAFILYDLYGPVPYPTDEMLASPGDIEYPERPSNEEFVEIIESLFADKDKLMDADFGSNFGRMNKGLANFILMRLYMLEAARTGDDSFWQKAKESAEAIISSGSYELQRSYTEVFSKSNQKNREIVFATPSDYSFNVNMWHSEALPNNYPAEINRGAGSWGGYKLLWSFYDTYAPNDQRLSTIAASYTTDDGVLVNRENPVNDRHGVGDGAIPVKYDTDTDQVGNFQGHDFIVYRYAEVLLAMSEILNELGETDSVNAPIITQQANDGELLKSDGGNNAFSFINAVRVRAGLKPLQGLGKSELRDALLQERGHELYAEGVRRADLIRYQRITNGNGVKKFDEDTNKFLFPIPVGYINEYKGNLKQNPGY
ncbi:Starch-binding associating with outer membrane [Salegentibacter holothuriorum]|uniref:Starch-binding associating with outer membrane n=1 Tax=Salegentibacter holothuriorum TaxID=241145 RepID=A0A1T5E9F0_9FLAO|nr:RagB/SusD family nutrient uptake outer membrane protein [Salegentibacter holothuriorum]SKB80496.1 Starch-binding associating with outer membrane [Salegentibacter holothuriorum]